MLTLPILSHQELNCLQVAMDHMIEEQDDLLTDPVHDALDRAEFQDRKAACQSLKQRLAAMAFQDSPAHPIFHRPITTLEEAQALLRYLVEKDLSYHPEDSAHDVIHPFTPEEATALDQRMEETYTLDWPEPYGCPCGYILGLTATPPEW
jgi:hypothetical protein